MVSLEELKVHYEWSREDEENLRSLAPNVSNWADEFIESFYDYLEKFEDLEDYIPGGETRERHREKVKKWFVEVFSQPYDENYLRKVQRIGEVHFRIGLPPHYVQASMSFVRTFLYEKLTGELGCTTQRDRVMKSVGKALDLNLDIILNSHRDEELKAYLSVGKLQNFLIQNVQKGLWFLDLFIAVSLFVVGAFLIAWVLYEFFLVIVGDLPLERGGLSILGSILIIYAISELLAHEIKHMRSGVISLKVFVGVALAALIRKILIVSLTPEKVHELLSLGGVIISLGVVYWLIHKVEGQAEKN